MAKKPSGPSSRAKNAIDIEIERANGLASDPQNVWRNDNVGRLALFCFNYLEAGMSTKLALQGFDVKEAHLRVFRHIDIGGTRVTEIAARAGVTKGAMSQVLAECERLGYVVATPDDVDARARVIKFTDLGRSTLQVFRTAIGEVESEFETAIGADRYERLKSLLSEIRDDLLARGDSKS